MILSSTQITKPPLPSSDLHPKSWTNNYLKDLVLYCTGLSPFSFTLIRLLL